MAFLERRRHSRIFLRIPIRFGSNETDCYGYTVDVSREGIGIQTTRVFPPGTKISLCMSIDSMTLRAKGVVVWARRVHPQLARYTRCGMQIEFTSLDGRFQQFLDEIFSAPRSRRAHRVNGSKSPSSERRPPPHDDA